MLRVTDSAGAPARGLLRDAGQPEPTVQHGGHGDRKPEPDMDRTAISDLSTSPNAGSRKPAAVGSATEL